jgi:hypothetical protein
MFGVLALGAAAYEAGEPDDPSDRHIYVYEP